MVIASSLPMGGLYLVEGRVGGGHGGGRIDRLQWMHRRDGRRALAGVLSRTTSTVGGFQALLNGFSVDVEEAFHASAFEEETPPESWNAQASRVERNVALVLELLDRAGVKGTFFILGWVADRHPAIVRTIHGEGHEIACHGFAHRRIYTQSPETFERDVARAKGVLEDIIGERIIGYRAPSFSITPLSVWALDILATLGFEYDSSIFPVRHDRYGFPGAPRFPYRLSTSGGASVIEVPPSSLQVAGRNIPVAGGGYLRLYPYVLTRFSIERLNHGEGEPAFIYVHPWELDRDQPRLSPRVLKWWRHSVGIGRIPDRLERLFRRFAFGRFRDVIASRDDWTSHRIDERGSFERD